MEREIACTVLGKENEKSHSIFIHDYVGGKLDHERRQRLKEGIH